MSAAGELFNKGYEKKEIEAVLGMNKNGIPVSIIAKSLNLEEEKVKSILEADKQSKTP